MARFDPFLKRFTQRDLLLVSHCAIGTADVEFIRNYLLFWQGLFDNATRGRNGRVVLAIPVSCETQADPWASPVPDPTTKAASSMVPMTWRALAGLPRRSARTRRTADRRNRQGTQGLSE